MKPWKTLDRDVAPGGGELVLQERAGELVIRVDGQELMSSRRHGSEEDLARAALEGKKATRVLIGGLGLGYTVRAALNLLPANAQVTVVELSSAVVRWNRGVLAPLAGAPLQDARVKVVEGDVGATLRAAEGAYDAILLDVDNGPAALTTAANQRLYSERGVAWCMQALARKGTLVVWSAGPDEAYLARLGKAGFNAGSRFVSATKGSRARHVLFIATRR